MLNSKDNKPLFADGSPGDYLGGPFPEGFNLSQPEQVVAAHRAFLEAGAQIVRTNTRHAQGPLLPSHGLEGRGEAINNSGMALLTDAAKSHPDAITMGSIGQMEASIPVSDRDQAYAQQIIYLSDTGVTFFVLEHFTHLEEALRVHLLIKNASDAPLLAPLVFNEKGLTTDGQTVKECGIQLAQAGVDALGIGCSAHETRWKDWLEDLKPTGLPLALFGGYPGPGQGATPKKFARSLAPFLDARLAIIGGCCQVGPDHIKALAGEKP